MRRATDGKKRKYTTITIPTALFEKLESQIANSSFSSVSDYATYILRETIFDLSSKKKGRDPGTVVQKLRDAGYKI